MRGQKRIRDKYLMVSAYVLKKLRYKVNDYDDNVWWWMVGELVLLIAYHIVSFATMGNPTPISLGLNILIVMRFIIGNHRENIQLVAKAKRNEESIENEYATMHAMIAVCEMIATALMLLMILWLGVDNNIGQVELATFVILCISFFEGWKDISVNFFDATPKVF